MFQAAECVRTTQGKHGLICCTSSLHFYESNDYEGTWTKSVSAASFVPEVQKIASILNLLIGGRMVVVVVMMWRGGAEPNCAVHCDDNKQPPHVKCTA